MVGGEPGLLPHQRAQPRRGRARSGLLRQSLSEGGGVVVSVLISKMILFLKQEKKYLWAFNIQRSSCDLEQQPVLSIVY